MKASNKYLFSIISEKELLKLIKGAKLVLAKDFEDMKVNDHNVLFGCSDYLRHENTFAEAKKLLREEIDGTFRTKQRINYYHDGKPFDTILFNGFRGGYEFLIGFSFA